MKTRELLPEEHACLVKSVEVVIQGSKAHVELLENFPLILEFKTAKEALRQYIQLLEEHCFSINNLLEGIKKPLVLSRIPPILPPQQWDLPEKPKAETAFNWQKKSKKTIVNLESGRYLRSVQNIAQEGKLKFPTPERPGLPTGLEFGQNMLSVGYHPIQNIPYLKLVLVLKREKQEPILAVMGFQSSDTFKSEYSVKAIGIEQAKYLGGLGLRGSKFGELDNVLFFLVKPDDQQKEPIKNDLGEFRVIRIFNVGKDKHKADIVRCKLPLNPQKPRTMLSVKSGGDFFILATVTQDSQVVLFDCEAKSDWYSKLSQPNRSKTIDLSQFSILPWKISSVCFDESEILIAKKHFRIYALMYNQGTTQLASLQVTRDETNHSLTLEDKPQYRLECSVSHLNVYYQHAFVVESLGLFILIGCRDVAGEKEEASVSELFVTICERGKDPTVLVARDFKNLKGESHQFTTLDIIKSLYLLVPDQGRPSVHLAVGVKNTNKILYILAQYNEPKYEKELPILEYKYSLMESELAENPKEPIELQDLALVIPVAYFGPKDKLVQLACIDKDWNILRKQVPASDKLKPILNSLKNSC